MYMTSRTALVAALVVVAGCSSKETESPNNDAGPGDPLYAVGSVVFNDDGSRTTYVQTIAALEGKVTNEKAIEVPGNGVLGAHGGSLFVGLAEEPTVIKYTPDAAGVLKEQGRVSFLNFGLTRADFGTLIVDDTHAYMVSSEQLVAILWNPQKMEITSSVDLSSLKREGFSPEFWTVTAHEGKVYIPARWADFDNGVIRKAVSLTVLDAATGKVERTMEDTRCYSGGRPVFAKNGDAYVMADGRNYSVQMFANATGSTPPPNCLLRIKAGATEFDAGYLKEIPSLTGGLEVVTELQGLEDESGIGFAKMFYPDKLPPEVKPVDFNFWYYPVFKTWRIELGDAPKAVEVTGLPYSNIGFGAWVVEGKLYSGESPDLATTEVWELASGSTAGTKKFTADGIFYGIYKLR